MKKSKDLEKFLLKEKKKDKRKCKMGIREDSLANKEIKKAKKLRNPENAQKSMRYEETSIKVIKIFTQNNC